MKYELVFLLSPKLSEDEAKKEATDLQKKMEEKGATIEREDFWGRRKLAYEIKHMSHAYYVLVIFESEGQVSQEISAMFNIEKEVLRHLLINYEGETKVSLEEVEEEKLVPQKSTSQKKETTKKEDKKEETEEVKKQEKKADSEVDSKDLDKKLDEILDKI